MVRGVQARGMAALGAPCQLTLGGEGMRASGVVPNSSIPIADLPSVIVSGEHLQPTIHKTTKGTKLNRMMPILKIAIPA